jgi:hypothetical protein
MEAHWCVEFTSIELAALVQKAAAGPVLTAGPWALEGHGGEGGKWIVALWRGGDTD